jgi:3-hydroxyisobutyrate dehydrogenase-like beta-hydroxyacid dehydrogenase
MAGLALGYVGLGTIGLPVSRLLAPGAATLVVVDPKPEAAATLAGTSNTKLCTLQIGSRHTKFGTRPMDDPQV